MDARSDAALDEGMAEPLASRRGLSVMLWIAARGRHDDGLTTLNGAWDKVRTDPSTVADMLVSGVTAAAPDG